MSNITFTSPYFTYNGSTSQVSRADNALLEPGTGDWTIEVWLRYNVSTGKTQTFVSKTNNGGAASNWSYGLRTNSAGATYFEVGNGTTSITSPSFNVLANTWYQVVGVWTNVVSNSIELYINGTSQGSNGHSFASILNSTNPLYLGNYNGNEFLQQFDGIMGVVRMYNNALSSAQVTQNYNYTYLKYISPTPTPTPTQTQTPSITPTISITPTKTLTPTPTNTPNLQGFSYSNFASTTGLVGVGNTSVSSNIYFLTTTAGGQVGNVYRTTAIQYNRNFSTQWSTFIGGGTGADGYCVQWTTTNNTNGPTGGGVGLITNAINAITFLTYTNNNYTWYSNNVSQGATSVSSGLWRQTLYFWGDYNHSAQTFALYYSTTNSKPGSPNKTFTSFSFDTGSYYMGFGAGTGGSTDNHELLSWSLTFT